MKLSQEWNQWLENRSDKEKVYLFLGGFLIIYILFYLFLQRPTSVTRENIKANISALQVEKTATQQKFADINNAIQNPIFLATVAKQNKLISQINDMEIKLRKLKPKLFSTEELSVLTKKILNEQKNNISLILLQELPGESWPTDDVNKKEIDKPNTPSDYLGIYQYTTQIEFQNNYFNTIRYLRSLESISSRLYWDSMEYKVLQYPNAAITIKFHVLSTYKSEV